MAKTMKRHLSIDGQIDLLKSRGLIVEDTNLAKYTLSRINYYRFTGYLFNDRIPGSDKYNPGTSFNNTLRKYEFDSRLTRVLMFALEDIEETLKTRFSYTLSSCFPSHPLIYLSPRIYRDKKELEKFKALFKTTVKNDKGIPFVNHHIVNYGGKLPVWVAVEILTMGMMNSLYNNLLPVYQKDIAKKYNTGSVQLSNWIENMRFTRNHLAHCMRIYRYNFGRIPKSCKKNPINAKYNGKIFDQIAIMSIMFSDKSEWNEHVLTEIQTLLNEYKDVVKPSDLGMPDNWYDVLEKG